MKNPSSAHVLARRAEATHRVAAGGGGGRRYELAYEALRRAIIRGIFPIGSRLVASTLARDLGFSRTPVRDALSRLATLGLVRRAGKTYAVVGLTSKDVDNIAAVRAVLEGAAAGLAAKEVTPADLKVLKGLLGEMDRAVEHEDSNVYRTYHRRFHFRIVASTGNPYFERSLEPLMDLVDLAWEASSPDMPRYELAQEQHREIVRALTRRDSKAARLSMIIHINTGMRKVSEALEGRSEGLSLREIVEEALIAGGHS